MQTDMDFKLSGTFNEEEDKSAAQLLKRLEWDLRNQKIDGEIPPDIELNAIELLLIDRAEE